jgi:hypothetical protein
MLFEDRGGDKPQCVYVLSADNMQIARVSNMRVFTNCQLMVSMGIGVKIL